MVEINISDAINKIQSSKVKERDEGLKDLKHIFTHNRQNPNIEALNNKAYHQLFEKLFRVVQIERSSYAKTAGTSKKQSATKLPACANLLRTAVEIGVRKIRYKTVKAVIEHIIQILPGVDEHYCEPLANDYIKALRVILGYLPHPEHLSRNIWHDVVDFCNEGICAYVSSLDEALPSTLTVLNGSNRFSGPESRSSTLGNSENVANNSSSFASKTSAGFHMRNVVEELAFCLQYLYCASNAPILEKAQDTMTVLFDLLKLSSPFGREHQAAFATINAVFSRVMTENVTLTRNIMKEVIPLIQRHWTARSTTLKGEMLITLTYIDFLIPDLIPIKEQDNFLGILQSLADSIQAEYYRRNERDQLQVDDLQLAMNANDNDLKVPLATRAFFLRSSGAKAEQAWATVDIIASIWTTLHHPRRTYTLTGDLDPPLKRQRVTQPVDDLLQQLRLNSARELTTALQVLAFVGGRMTFDSTTLKTINESLMPFISSDTAALSNWAMLAAASIACLEASTKLERESSLQIWRLAARNVTSISTSQTACYVMTVLLHRGLVEFSDVVDVVDNMLSSVDLNGPAIFTDSAVLMWCALVDLKARVNPSSIQDTSERILRWLFVRWSPSKLDDRHRAAQLAHHCQPSSILKLLSSIFGIQQSNLKHASTIPEYNSISQAKFRCIRYNRLVRYLILIEAPLGERSSVQRTAFEQAQTINLSDSRFQYLLKLVVDFLVAELTILLNESPFSGPEGIQGVNVETIVSCCSVCVVSFGVLGSPRVNYSSKVQQLRSMTAQLRTNIAGNLLRHDDPRSLTDGLFKSFGNFLGNSGYDDMHTDLLIIGAREMSLPFGPSFWGKLHSVDADDSIDVDIMELDDIAGSQRTHTKGGDTVNDISHDEIAAMTNHTAYQASMAAKICFFSTLKVRGESDDPFMPLEYVEYLTSLLPNKFLACRSFLQELLGSGIDINERCGCLVLNYLGNYLLRPYEFERCEVSSGVCLDTMTSLAKEWTNTENSDISSLGSDIYKWLTNITLEDGVASPHVHLRMAAMLQHVIKVGPESARIGHLPSARTTLFKILKNGNAAVIFYVGLGISDIFALFVLKEHEAMLEDLIQNLPGDPGWTEGIALRLYILAHLGSSWHTLLRRCVYAIFETPRHVTNSTDHAKYCVKYLSDNLGLKSPGELFRLFVSQIIYTWLEVESLSSIPFAIFGYNSLPELLTDVQDEITGQVTMRGREDEVQQLVQQLGTSFERLLEMSFSKASAYSIGRDAAVPPTRDIQAAKAEVRLRKRVGKEHYGQLMESSFPEILCLFFMIIDQEDNVQKGFQKNKTYEAAGRAYDDIVSAGASTVTLPINQQPCFKARYLVDEIDYLCQRTSRSSSAIWTPALYVYVFRELFNSIHTALGSLHTCSVIRRLRILICMARETALRDYPLEMTLRSLRPFLTDIHCAEDVIGICRYVIENSTSYLQQVPSFLAGFVVSTLVSTKAFLATPQESTTQESQHRSTMSKAQEFHRWLGALGDEYTTPLLPDIAEQSFKAMVSSARQVHGVGSARKGSYEGDLLLELLDDQRSGRLLINLPSRNLILGLLCSSFEVPQDFRDDILGDAKQASIFAPTVWNTCHGRVYGSDYLLWVGRVLGRAYCSSGSIDNEILREVKPEILQTERNLTQQTLSSYSRSMVLNLLADLIHTDDRQDVGVAETTLQRIVTKTTGTSYSTECEKILPPSLLNALIWEPYTCPRNRAKPDATPKRLGSIIQSDDLTFATWVEHVCITLARVFPDDPLLSELAPILHTVEGVPERTFKYILHIVLLGEAEVRQTVKGVVSDAAQKWFCNESPTAIPYNKLFLQAVLYLHCQPMVREATKADRARWLDFDYKKAAEAAIRCQMFKTALLFIEIDASESSEASRRSSERRIMLPNELLLRVFQNLDDRDSIYGIQQPSNINSTMEQLEYENAGFRSLSFRGAYHDSKIRYSTSMEQGSEEGMIKVLDRLDLNGLSHSLLINLNSMSSASAESMLRTARKLERWDITVPLKETGQASVIFKVFQGIHNASDPQTITNCLNQGYSTTMRTVLNDLSTLFSLHSALSSLAVLTEVEEVLSARDLGQLTEACSNFESRREWMVAGSLEYVSNISSCRETLFSVLSKSGNLQRLLNVSARIARQSEVRTLLFTSGLSRHHRALQSALKTATYLAHIIQPCKDLGLNIDAAVQYEGSNVLWDQNEMSASIRMLEGLVQNTDTRSQDIHVSRSELLTKLGHRISEARLEKPDEIIASYLIPAIEGLRGVTEGKEAGQAFHEFAYFCDQQLQNPENLEDYQRMQKLRERKEDEVRELDRMIKAAGSQAKEKENLKSYRTKAKQWFELDDREFQRLRKNRQTFLRQSLENYLLSLKACDIYDSDALRFSALWLEHSEEDVANLAVSKSITTVNSRKFAALMNQWTSRLLDSPSQFQGLLSSLVLRVCIEHPFHGMYQIFASSKTKGGKDEAALARNAAASKIVNQIKTHKRAAPIWVALHNTSINYVRFAAEKFEDSKIKPGSKVFLRKTVIGPKIEQDVSIHRVPPPTMKIHLRSDCDYTGTPFISKFSAEFGVASGISMPKILTATASDGKRYKMLFKSGNDDLRQDSIMEQVFEQVSNLLQTHRETRQRNLGIRTYKVLPLTATSGIIEFVSDTIPLHDYLMPAHQQHFPGDWKTNVCRKHIADVQSKPVDHRIKVFRQVMEKFHPVMRYFFTERFENPDDWYERRLAYTRSTAAISILGHVLGLGDRHGHNILLDETSGEVVHIDLGIAFEQGRVLPIPEVVPFRLTRDLVDGMGITGTRGGFQRCCEFTLEALRHESYTIMTILDVLRYDPLYSWSLSPLRLRKLQNEQDEGHPPTEGEDANLNKRKDSEPGEADRALTVVSKKLSKSLSVTATVNELIQQATDVRNLAVLFCGWAAYA